MLIVTILAGMLLFLVALGVGVALGRAVAFPLPHCAPHLITLPCRRCLEGEPEEEDEPYDAAAWDREITEMLVSIRARRETGDAQLWVSSPSRFSPSFQSAPASEDGRYSQCIQWTRNIATERTGER